MSDDWQRRRVAFSHDWLKNRFLPALANWQNVIDGKVDDLELQYTFETDVLSQWAERRTVAMALLGEFEAEMAPQQLFVNGALKTCEEPARLFLSELMDGLWRFRYRVPILTRLATARVAAADSAYELLRVALGRYNLPHDRSVWQAVRVEFEQFAKNCRRLGRVLGRFPGEIRVV